MRGGDEIFGAADMKPVSGNGFYTAAFSFLVILSLTFSLVRTAAAVPMVSLGCMLGGSGTRWGCNPTLSDAAVGSFSEPASFSADYGTPANGGAYYQTSGSYSQGSFSFHSLARGYNPASIQGMGSSGLYSIDNLVLTYIGSGTPGSASVSMNLSVTGTNDSFASTGFASTNLHLSGGIAGTRVLDNSFDIYGGLITPDGILHNDTRNQGNKINGGIYARSFDSIVTTLDVSVNAGQVFGASFGFDSAAYILGSNNLAEQTINAAGWIPGMRVFNTPVDYVVNSTDGLIVNNVFMPVAAVPESATIWLFGSGLLGGLLVMAARRQADA